MGVPWVTKGDWGETWAPLAAPLCPSYQDRAPHLPLSHLGFRGQVNTLRSSTCLLLVFRTKEPKHLLHGVASPWEPREPGLGAETCSWSLTRLVKAQSLELASSPGTSTGMWAPEPEAKPGAALVGTVLPLQSPAGPLEGAAHLRTPRPHPPRSQKLRHPGTAWVGQPAPPGRLGGTGAPDQRGAHPYAGKRPMGRPGCGRATQMPPGVREPLVLEPGLLAS